MLYMISVALALGPSLPSEDDKSRVHCTAHVHKVSLRVRPPRRFQAVNSELGLLVFVRPCCVFCLCVLFLLHRVVVYTALLFGLCVFGLFAPAVLRWGAQPSYGGGGGARATYGM